MTREYTNHVLTWEGNVMETRRIVLREGVIHYGVIIGEYGRPRPTCKVAGEDRELCTGPRATLSDAWLAAYMCACEAVDRLQGSGGMYAEE